MNAFFFVSLRVKKASKHMSVELSTRRNNVTAGNKKPPKTRIDIKSPKRLFIEHIPSAALSGESPTHKRKEENFIHFYSKNKPTQSSFSLRTVFFFLFSFECLLFSFLLWRAIISHKTQAHTNANKFLPFSRFVHGLRFVMYFFYPQKESL